MQVSEQRREEGGRQLTALIFMPPIFECAGHGAHADGVVSYAVCAGEGGIFCRLLGEEV